MSDGGTIDPEKNTALAAVLKAAKVSGVPKDNIERALTKVCTLRLIFPACRFSLWVQASGGKDKGSQLITYEALAYGSVGVIM